MEEKEGTEQQLDRTLQKEATSNESFDVKRSKMNTARPSDSQSVSSYTSSHGRKAKCSEKATQFLCSASLLCICCPLNVVWCCIKVPCKVGSQAAQHVRRCACGSAGKRVYASYSSFSDIDLDSLPGKAHGGTTCSKTPWQLKKSALQHTKR